MKIRLLRNHGCHVWQKAEKALKGALTEANLPLDYEIIVIEDDNQASLLEFPGSPTIKVNGQDVDPKFLQHKNFSADACRIYLYKGSTFEYPPKEMVLEALTRLP